MVVKPSIGRKTNKNPPIFSHEFVIQNHADIVSCVVMVFLVGLMVQATSPLASTFITLHHNVSGVEPTREQPIGEQFTYEAGWKDACVVFFYTLVCIVLHAIVQEYVLDKISKRYHLSKSRLSALNESGQLLVFHAVSFLWGADAINREGFVFNISQLWAGYPNHPMSFLLKLFWVVQASYWLHSIPELYFQRIKREEWSARIQQAIIGFTIITLAYAFKLHRVGVCMIVLHAIAEAYSHLFKLCIILRGDRADSIEKVLGFVTGVVFVLARLATLVLSVLVFYFGLAGIASVVLRAVCLAAIFSFQVYLMYNKIQEVIAQRKESLAAQNQIKAKKEKKEKPKKEKVKKMNSEESDLPEVDQETNKSLRQRQPSSPKQKA